MNKTILIVDDQDDPRNLYKLILEREGFQTVLAKDANTALAVLSEYVPDLIILDVMMPGIDGIELCRMIRTRHTTLTTPILVISAHAGPEYMTRAKDAGADEYIPKVNQYQHILVKVRKLLNLEGGSHTITPEMGRPSPLQAPAKLPSTIGGKTRDQWIDTITNLLRHPSREMHGQAIIYLAFSQSGDNTYFSQTPGQRFFWRQVRHTLEGGTNESARQHWATLAPVVQALIQPPDSLDDALVTCTRHPDLECRQWALLILLENRSPSAVEMAVQRLSDESGEVRSAAAKVLSVMGTEREIPVFVRGLNDPEVGMREQTAKGLAQIGGQVGTMALLTALEHGSAEAAEAVAHAVATLNTDEAIEGLVSAARQRQESRVLRQIAYALSTLQDDRCREALIELSDHELDEVREAARMHLEAWK